MWNTKKGSILKLHVKGQVERIGTGLQFSKVSFESHRTELKE